MKKTNNKKLEPVNQDSENQQKKLDNMLDELVEENKSRIGGIKKIIDDVEKRIKNNNH